MKNKKRKKIFIVILLILILVFSIIVNVGFNNDLNKINKKSVKDYNIPKFALSISGNYNMEVTETNMQNKSVNKYDFHINASSKKIKTLVYGVSATSFLKNLDINDYSEVEFVGINSSVRYSKDELKNIIIAFDYMGDTKVSMINMKDDYSYSIIDLIGINPY